MAIRVGAGVPPPDLAHGFHVRIVYMPGELIAGFVNGVECARIVDQSKFPDPGGATKVGYQCFGQSGTNALANISTAFWFMRQTLYLR